LSAELNISIHDLGDAKSRPNEGEKTNFPGNIPGHSGSSSSIGITTPDSLLDLDSFLAAGRDLKASSDGSQEIASEHRASDGFEMFLSLVEC
jgi:hypothetical protein